MNFRKSAVALLAITMIAVSGCSKDVPQDIVDQNMTITRLNAQKNADAYFAVRYPAGTADANPRLGEPIRALMQSDSSITKQCRNGDGWASGVIQYKNGQTLKIRCQTNGTGKGINGCMTEVEFATKTYKDEEGRCQNLESLEKFK